MGGEGLLTHFLQKALLECGFPGGPPPVASVRGECSSADRCVDSRAIGSLPGELRWEGRDKGLRMFRTVVLSPHGSSESQRPGLCLRDVTPCGGRVTQAGALCPQSPPGESNVQEG